MLLVKYEAAEKLVVLTCEMLLGLIDPDKPKWTLYTNEQSLCGHAIKCALKTSGF